MRQFVCDKCRRIIVGGMNDRPYIWHRSIPAEDHDAHFDLCENCDSEVTSLINIGHLPALDLS